jgi:hypothetical protein
MARTDWFYLSPGQVCIIDCLALIFVENCSPGPKLRRYPLATTPSLQFARRKIRPWAGLAFEITRLFDPPWGCPSSPHPSALLSVPAVATRLADGAQVPRIVRSANFDLNDVIHDGRHNRAARQPKLAGVAVADQDELPNGTPGRAMVPRVSRIGLLRRWPPSGRPVLGGRYGMTLPFGTGVAASGIDRDAATARRRRR